LRRVLGQGAQAKVWLAYDPRLEREVAIKLMLPEQQSSASQVNQWLQEARSVSRLTHPNIVPVFEADVFEPVALSGI
jgi:serine/threonine protein kinase